MQVIFTQDVPGIARRNEVKTVKTGYFHNFLLPKGLAVNATKDRMKAIEKVRKEEGLHLEELEENASSIEKTLNGATVTIAHKASEKGKLYASVTDKEIVAAIKAELKIELPESNLKMEHFKEVGEYEVEVDLPRDHSAKLKVVIEAEANE